MKVHLSCKHNEMLWLIFKRNISTYLVSELLLQKFSVQQLSYINNEMFSLFLLTLLNLFPAVKLFSLLYIN